MVGPAVLTFVKELGEFYGGAGHPEIFGFIDRLEAVDIASPGLEFLEGSHFWEGHPRTLQPGAAEHETAYRAAVGVDDNGASVADPRDVSTYAHMFSTWETLFVIKAAMEAASTAAPTPTGDGRGDRGDDRMPAGPEHPQGDKVFNGKTHQVFGTRHLEGRRRRARRRASHRDRGRTRPARGRLHDDGAGGEERF